jgi:hypothetical protein
MEIQEIMEALAEHYEIEPNENGDYDLEDYDWQAGCYTNGKWMSLAEIVKIIERSF